MCFKWIRGMCASRSERMNIKLVMREEGTVSILREIVYIYILIQIIVLKNVFHKKESLPKNKMHPFKTLDHCHKPFYIHNINIVKVEPFFRSKSKKGRKKTLSYHWNPVCWICMLLFHSLRVKNFHKVLLFILCSYVFIH